MIECAEFLSTVLIVWPSKTNSKKFTKSIVVCSFLGWTYCFIARPVRSVPGWRHLMANPICQAAALADGTEYFSKGMSKQCTGHVTTCTLFGCEWCDLMWFVFADIPQVFGDVLGTNWLCSDARLFCSNGPSDGFAILRISHGNSYTIPDVENIST